MNCLKKLNRHLAGLLFTGLLLSLPLSAYATEPNVSEKTYTITEYQLTELESKLSRLATSNEALALDCKELQEQLAASQAALEAAKKESEQLKTQLAELTMQSRSSEALLQTANASLEAYAKEAKRKTAIIKTQRNIAWCVAGAVIAYTVKR